MANLSGLGSFAQGLAGGIQQGTQNYANLVVKGREFEEEKKKSALQQEYMNLHNDTIKYESALKVVKNAKDIQAAWDYIEKLDFKNPYHKTALQNIVITDTNRQGDLIKFTEKINALAKNPTPDSFKQIDLLLAEAKVAFDGEDSNEYKSLDAVRNTLKGAHKQDDMTNLTTQVDQYANLGKTLEQKSQQPTGLLQQQPTITDEELDIINKGKAALINLQVKYPDQYKLVAERYGLKNSESEKEFNMSVDLDTILPPIVAKHGIDMSTPKGRKQAYRLYATNPEVKKEFDKEWERRRMTAPSTNVFIGTDPTTGNPIIMPSKGEPKLKEVESPSGGIAGKTVSEDYKKDVTAVKQAGDLVANLKKSWDKLGITTRGSAVAEALKGKTGFNPNAKVYMDAKDAFLGNLSRSLAAERGVLTQQDIERISGILADVGLNPFEADSKAEADKKWKMIDDIIQSAHVRLKERKGITYKTEESPQGNVTKSGNRFTVEEVK